VQAALDRARAQNWAPGEATTAPGRQRESRATVAQPHRKPGHKQKRGMGLALGGFLGLLVLGLGGAVWYHFSHGAISLHITVEPAGAEVLRDERMIGVAPLSLTLQRGETANFSFRKEGFLPSQRTVTATADQPLSVRLLARPAPEPVEPPPPAPPTPPPATPAPHAPPPDKPTVAEKPAAKPAVAATKPPHHHHEPRAKEKKSDQLLLMPSF
jgi:hypothetical protein